MPMLRRALGAVKDQASIGLARVCSSSSQRVPALEIAIVKATSHDELELVDEKHILELVQIMSFSRGYASVCVSLLAKRLGKTRNWVVALKVLVVIHRLLLQDSSVIDSTFDDELMLASRRMLSLSSFRDATKDPLAELCSSFVRNYALYIDEWLDCFVLGAASSQQQASAGGSIVVNYNDYRTDYSTYKQDECNLFPQYDHAKNNNYNNNTSASETDTKVKTLLNRIPVLQHLLERVLSCSAGVEVQHPLVRLALTLVVRDSFRVYTDVCDGMSTLLNEFFLMVHKDGLKALAVYSRMAKQAEAVGQLYVNCRELGICAVSEYPSVQKVSQEHLCLLDDYLKESTRNKSSGKVDKVPDVKEGELSPATIEKQEQEVDVSFSKHEQEGQEQEKPVDSSVHSECTWETFGSASEERTGALPAELLPVEEETVTEGQSSNAGMNRETGSTSSPSSNSAAEWEIALMNEAKKLSYSLSKRRRATSFSVTVSDSWDGTSSNSPRRTSARPAGLRTGRNKVASLSLFQGSGMNSPTGGGGGGEQSLRLKTMQKGRAGFGSAGSYGKLMNKHPQGYKHLVAQNSTG